MTKNQDYVTKSRKLILSFLEKNIGGTVSVADIMNFLKENGLEVNLSTVYRYLNKLTNGKKVLKLVDENGKRSVYQLVGHQNSCNEHIHIQCTVCGKLEHIECDFMEHLRTHLKDEHGFEIKCDGSILYGICSCCKK